MVRLSRANSLQQTSGVQWGFSRICRHSRTGSLHTGPSWKDAETNYSIKAHFQNHVRAFQRMLRSRERMPRSTSSPDLPSRRAQCSGQVVWPISTRRTSIPLGMEVRSDMQISVPRFLSLLLPIPEHLFMAIGWTRRFRVLCYRTLGALDRLTLYFRFLRGRSWLCGRVFRLPLASLLWVLRCRRLLPRRCLY